MSKIPVVDLFAGAGGLGLGVLKAGGDLRLSVEISHIACETLRANTGFHTGEVLESDVRLLNGDDLRRLAGLGRHDPLIIAGGPPCQPFSKAAYWTDPGDDSKYRRARAQGKDARKPEPISKPRPDTRRSLLWEFFRLIQESRAEAFLLENVPSILHPRNKATFMNFKNTVESAGFKTSLVKANAVEYGIPQKRERVFLLAIRGEKPVVPEQTHAKDGLRHLYRQPPVTTGEVLEPFGGEEYFEPEEVVAGKWAEHLRSVPPGMNYKALTEWAGHPNPTFVAETRFWSFLLKLHPELPSWTIAATPGPWTGPFHWGSRRLRTPELAALQGFPAGYSFKGNRRERVCQIGNAIPPLLAAKMLEGVIKTMNG